MKSLGDADSRSMILTAASTDNRWRHEVTMNHRYVPAILTAAGILAAAQSSPLRPSQPYSDEEALRLVAKGQFAEAHQLLAGVLEDAQRNGSPPAYRVELWRLLGSTENRLGRYGEAEATLNRGLEICDQSQQIAPELTIALLLELADANLNQGHLEDANRVLRRALRMAARDLPPGHPRFGAVQHSLGVLFWMKGDLSRAEKAFRQALTILENCLGPDHADVAVAASGLAGLLTMTRREPEGISLLDRSKAIFDRLYGPRHPDTISATFALGTALIKFSPARAELMLRDAIGNWQTSQPEHHPHMIKFLSALARSRCAQRDYREARILSGQALQMSREIFGAEHPYTVAQMYSHAQLLKDSGRRKEAAVLMKDADRIRALKGYGEPGDRIDILALR